MNTDSHTRPISARVDPDTYSEAFALCSGRDCSVSELVGQLLTDAIASGAATKMVTIVELENAAVRAQLSEVDLRQRLRNAKKQCLLFEAALIQVSAIERTEAVALETSL